MADSFQNYLAGFKAVTDAQQGSGENLGSLFLRGMERGQAMRLRKEQSAMDKERLEMDKERAKLDQALAPLQLEQSLQALELNSIKLEEARRMAQNEITAQRQFLELGEAANELFKAGPSNPQAQGEFYNKAYKLKELWSTPGGRDALADVQRAIQAAATTERYIEVERERTKRSAEIQDAITKRTFAKEQMEQEFEREMNSLDNATKVAIAEMRAELQGGARKQMSEVDFNAQIGPKIREASYGRKSMDEAFLEASRLYKKYSLLLEDDATMSTRVPRTTPKPTTPPSGSVAQPRRIRVVKVNPDGTEQRGTVSESALPEALKQGYKIVE